MSKKSKPKLTPWFDGRTRPQMTGVYERRVGVHISEGAPDYPNSHGGFAYWNGRRWSPCRPSPDRAMTAAHNTSGFKVNDMSVWRGLAKNPSPGAGHEGAEA